MLTKMDQFSENFQGGVISDPKNFVADFSIINEHFFGNFEGKNDEFSGSRLSEKFCCRF